MADNLKVEEARNDDVCVNVASWPIFDRKVEQVRAMQYDATSHKIPQSVCFCRHASIPRIAHVHSSDVTYVVHHTDWVIADEIGVFVLPDDKFKDLFIKQPFAHTAGHVTG